MYRTKLIILGLLLICISPASAWWNTDWGNRREIQINNTLGSELTYYQVYVNLTDNPINSTSLRVINKSSGIIVPHWQETIVNNNCTELWFNVTTVPAAVWLNETYYIYYGNAEAASDWDIGATFLFGDDFSGSAIDINKWDGATEYASVASNILTLDCGGNTAVIYSKVYNHSINGVVIEYKGKPGSTTGWTRGVGSKKYTAAANVHKGMGGIANYGGGNEYVKVWDYNGISHIENLAFSNTWIDQQVILKPAEISVTASGVTSSIANTLESHPVAIYCYQDCQIQNFRVRKYAANPPTYVLGEETVFSIPPIPINLDYSKGFFWVNHTWDAGTGNITDSYNVSHNGLWYNNTVNTYYNSGDIGDGGYSEILIYAYNNTGMLSVEYIIQNISAPPYTPPPIPINLQYTKGEWWVNHTWEKGVGIISNSYNVSHNGSWTNGSSDTYFNSGHVGRNGISTIIVYAFNGLLSEEYITQTISTQLGIDYEQKISNQNIQSIYFPLMFILLMFIIVGAFKYMFMDKK